MTAGEQTDYIAGPQGTLARIKNNVVTYLHHDILGSAQSGTNLSGVVQWREQYSPFGEELQGISANTDQAGYTGHIRDAATGLSYMQARYYGPVIGRFYSNDPKGTLSFLSEGKTQGFNRYVYAVNNPYRYVDPDGRDYEESFLSLKVPFLGALEFGIVDFKPNASGQGNTTSGIFFRFSTSASNVDSNILQGGIEQKGVIAGLTFGMGAGTHTDQNFDEPSASIDVGFGVGIHQNPLCNKKCSFDK